MTYRHVIRLLVTLVFLVGFSGPIDAKPMATSLTKLPLDLTEWRLANGMRVFYVPMNTVPAVTVQVWYHTGSKNEQPGIRGLAHLFEHMMFKGSTHVPPEEHARLISAIGGESNAFTTEDVTAYHDTVPRQYLEFAMQLEAERMKNLHLTPFTIASEREVVKEEKRMREENNPTGKAEEALLKMAFTKHPYRWTVAGEMADLAKVSVEDCRKFYQTHYNPSNAALIVVGDVSEIEVRAAADKYFAKLTAAPAPPAVTVREPAQSTLREKKANWPSQLNIVLGGYHIVEAAHPDYPALDVLSTILSSGQSSRLYQSLVRKRKIVVGAGGATMGLENPSLFYLFGVGLPSSDLTKIKDALLEEVQLVIDQGVSEAELRKAKNQMTTDILQSLKRMDGLASQIGYSTFLEGNPRAFLTRVSSLDAVTIADVQRVAKKYLQRDNLSLVLLPAVGAGGGK